MSFILAVCFALSVGNPDPAASLIVREKAKWDFQHLDAAKLAAEYAPDFVEIGYKPEGVRRQVRPDIAAAFRELQTSAPSNMPPWTLSDFEVVRPSRDTVILSYRAEGFLKLYATTVWALRDGKWVSVFYQATSR